jgi:hypothetical protein
MSNETLSKPGMDRYYCDTVGDNAKAAAALYSTVVWSGCDDASNEKRALLISQRKLFKMTINKTRVVINRYLRWLIATMIASTALTMAYMFSLDRNGRFDMHEWSSPDQIQEYVDSCTITGQQVVLVDLVHHREGPCTGNRMGLVRVRVPQFARTSQNDSNDFSVAITVTISRYPAPIPLVIVV